MITTITLWTVARSPEEAASRARRDEFSAESYEAIDWRFPQTNRIALAVDIYPVELKIIVGDLIKGL